MPSSFILTIPTTTSPVRVTRLRKLPPSVDQATMTLAGSSAALPVSARYSDFVRAPMGPIERSSGHGAWKAEVSAALDVGESWNLGVFLAHALKAHGQLLEQQGDVVGDAPQAVWATGAVDVIDLRILPVSHIETKLRQVLGTTPVPDLFLLPPDNLGDVPAELRAELEARGTRIIAAATMSEALEALGLPSDWAKEAAPNLAGWRGDPYRGLEAYEAEHRPIFFGRASARTEALERLRTRAERGTSLLVIHGKSGVGKSSLAMAGLLDDVVEQVPGRAPFGTAAIRFGDGATPLAALHAGFAQALEMEEASTFQSSSAAEWLETWPANSEPRTLLLILDQLEQALLADEADTIAFGEAIATLVRTGRVWVIATLRSDRIDLLERAPALAEMADGDALYRLVRPTLAELGEIIRAPAKLAGIAFEEGSGTDLVNLLAEEAMRAPDSLPLLQVTLMRLADQRDAEGRVGMRDYERIGGFSGAVGRLADETVRKMEADGIDGNVVDRTLASLVRIDPDTDRVDARVVDPDAQTAEVQQVLSALVEARLATASTVREALDPDADGGSDDSTDPNDSGRRVRLAHETLIREWPRLHDLAARLRSELSLRDRLEDDALRWEQDGRPTGDLIRNTARLVAAEALVADGLATPSPQAQTYVEASRDEVERQAEQQRAAAALEHRTRTRRRITTSAAIVAFVMVGLTGFAINQAQQKQAAEEIAEIAEAAAEQQRQLNEIASEARIRAEEAADLQASLAEEQTLRREAAEQASTEAARLTESAVEAQLRAEDRLKQAQINQALYLMEAARSATERDPPRATAIISELPDIVDKIGHLNLYHEALDTASYVGMGDREISRHLSSVIVNSVSFAPSGKELITGSWDHKARVWDISTGELLQTLGGHESIVETAQYSPDGRFVITASFDKTARVWDVDKGTIIHTLVGHESGVDAAVFSPDGSLIATASSDATSMLWDVATGEKILVYNEHSYEVETVAFSPDSTRVATGSRDDTARLWDVATGKTIQVFEGHTDWITSIAFSPDGNSIVTGSNDGTARVWDVTTGKTSFILEGHNGSVTSVAFSPDGTRIVSGSSDTTALIWDVSMGNPIMELNGHDLPIESVAFSPDGRLIASGSLDGSSRIWNVALGTYGLSFESAESWIGSVEFSPDGKQVVIGSGEGSAHVWDVANHERLMTLGDHDDSISRAIFSRSGTEVFTASWDGTVQVSEVSSGEKLLVLEGHGSAIYDVAASPNGALIATSSRDGTARIWNMRTGSTIFILEGHTNTVFSVDFSPNSNQLATASADGTALIWNVATGEIITRLQGHNKAVNDAVFFADGSHIVTVSDDLTARIWDLSTGETVSVLEGHTSVISDVAISPNGAWIVTVSSGEHVARVWDLKTGSHILNLEGHQDTVTSALFSPDGTEIMTGSWDGTARIWDVSMPTSDQYYERLPLVAFESNTNEKSRQFFQLVSSFDRETVEQLLRARNGFAKVSRFMDSWVNMEMIAAQLLLGKAADQGVPEAHEYLSSVMPTGDSVPEQELEAALFHAAIATRIYEALGDQEAAARIRIRRANLARSLPPQTVASLWPHIRDWRPLEKE